MSAIRQYIAYFLLLLFCRILAPEQALLALHTHKHTEHEHKADGFAHIDAKHTHCHVDNFFDAPFLHLPQYFTFQKPAAFAIHPFVYQSVWKFTFPNNVCLRGPPALS